MAGYSFKEVEAEIGAYWDSHKKEIDAMLQFDPKKPLFSWLEGPPTANAPPGLHHVEVRVFKDVMLRWKTMQGFTVPRKGGWDCHGLPVEVQVEKKLGLKSKKAVMTFGVPRFIDECKKDVFKFVEQWNENTRKLGFWVDLENAYMTLSTPYMESVWWSLQQLFNKGLLYEGYKVVPYCPHCETPLSSHEVAQGYQDIEEKTVAVTFNLTGSLPAYKDARGVKLLVWTTTPWTLPANVSIAVNMDMIYALVKEKEKYYVLAEELIDKYFKHAQKLAIFPGRDLVGMKYEPLFPYFSLKKGYIIMHADYVTAVEGTGIVHQASAYGEVDFEANNKEGIDFVHPVQKDGTFGKEVTDFAGMFVKDADPLIVKKLEDEGKLFKAFDYAHSYPFCWRCGTPLLYYAMDTWFVRVSEMRNLLVERNQQIEWYPGNVKDGRFGNWLEGAKDWALSRNKFWGTPIPVWKCGCGHQECIGSIKELEEKTATKGVNDLHITSVDHLEIRCPACMKKGVASIMKRTPEVIDCWYDSGSASFAQFHYPFENKELFEKRFPYDFIVEAIDQTRGWFYTLHVLGVLLFDKPAYKSVAVGGLLCDENGEKMSKTKGNIVNPDETFGENGVDAVRLAMCSYPLGGQIRYGPSIFKDVIIPHFNTLWNSYVYISSFLASQGLDGGTEPSKLEEEDIWIISRINTIIKQVTQHLSAHEYNHAISKIMSFVGEDFSRGYLKMIRDRTSQQDEAAAHTVRYVMERVILLTAPFTPYIAEKLYQNFMKDHAKQWSVHSLSWPEPDEKIIDNSMERHMHDAQTLITALLAAREKSQQGVRWPMPSATVDLSEADKSVEEAYLKLSHLVKKQTNIREIVFDRFTELDYDFKPDYETIGKEFGERTADILTTLPKQKPAILSALRSGAQEFDVAGHTLRPEHLVITKIPPKHIVHADFGESTVYIDTRMDDSLMAEGYARELTRRLQDGRKEMGLQKGESIKLAVVSSDNAILKNLQPHFADLQQKVNAKKFSTSRITDADFSKEVKIKDVMFTVQLKK